MPIAQVLPLASPSLAAERIYLHKALLAPERRRMTDEADGMRVRESACAHAFHVVISAPSYDPVSGRTLTLVAPLTMQLSSLRLCALAAAHRACSR